MSAEQPVSVTRARQLLAALVALGAVVTVLIVVLQDQLIRSWAQGRPDTRKVLRSQGLDAVKDGEVHVPAFIPVGLVLFVVVALLIWVLAAFLRSGYGWARMSLASFPIEVAAAYYLWHKDTSAYLRGTWAPEAQDAPSL